MSPTNGTEGAEQKADPQNAAVSSDRPCERLLRRSERCVHPANDIVAPLNELSRRENWQKQPGSVRGHLI
jgi:hypothetical protein